MEKNQKIWLAPVGVFGDHLVDEVFGFAIEIITYCIYNAFHPRYHCIAQVETISFKPHYK